MIRALIKRALQNLIRLFVIAHLAQHVCLSLDQLNALRIVGDFQ